MDLSKAFDTVDYHLLLQKLMNIGLTSVTTQWLWLYLTNRSQITSVGEHTFTDRNAFRSNPTLHIGTSSVIYLCQRPFRLLLLFPFLSLGLYLLAIFSLAMCFSKLVAWRRLKHFSLFLFEALNSLYVLKCKNLAENVWHFLSWFPGTFIDLVTLTIGTPDLSDEKKESLKEILKPSVTAYMKYHRPSTLLDFDNFFGHMTKIYRTALVSVKISSLVISVKCPTLESLERLWKDYQSGCLNDIAERFLVTDELKRKLGLDNIRLKTTIEEENYLICKRAFLENSG